MGGIAVSDGDGVAGTGDRLAAQIGRCGPFFLCLKPILPDELGDAPLHLRPRQTRRCAAHSHRKSRKIVAVLGAEETELLALTDSALEKLRNMSDVEYAEFDLFPDFEETE